MFNCSQKHVFLQQACGLHPAVINRAVDFATIEPLALATNAGKGKACKCNDPAPEKRITVGFGRIGLRNLSRQLSDKDAVIQTQAVQIVLDLVHNPEKALVFIDMFITAKLVILLKHENPTIRENSCKILDVLATTYKGRIAIIKKAEILNSLLQVLKTDKVKDVRYQAAKCIQTLAMDYYTVHDLMLSVPDLINEMLELLNEELDSIVIIHLGTLELLFTWENEIAIQNGAFTLMVELLNHHNTGVLHQVLNCLTQLLQNPKVQDIADEIDVIFLMLHFLKHKDPLIILAAVRVLMFATLTTCSKWRARECVQLPDALVQICFEHYYPPMQLSCLQVLHNLSDNPVIRSYMKTKLLKRIEVMKFATPEQWNGVLETSKSPYDNNEHYYRCMYIMNYETIDNHLGDNPHCVNVHSYLNKLYAAKKALIDAINWVPYVMEREIPKKNCHF